MIRSLRSDASLIVGATMTREMTKFIFYLIYLGIKQPFSLFISFSIFESLSFVVEKMKRQSSFKLFEMSIYCRLTLLFPNILKSHNK